MNMLNCTAAALRAMLCFCDPNNTPKIAFDKDEFAQPLIDKIKEAVGDRDGSQPVYLTFNEDEKELLRQFNGVASILKQVFDSLEYCTQSR
jgi:hypothetical protein